MITLPTSYASLQCAKTQFSDTGLIELENLLRVLADYTTRELPTASIIQSIIHVHVHMPFMIIIQSCILWFYAAPGTHSAHALSYFLY